MVTLGFGEGHYAQRTSVCAYTKVIVCFSTIFLLKTVLL